MLFLVDSALLPRVSLQHRKQRHPSLAEWQQKRKERQCFFSREGFGALKRRGSVLSAAEIELLRKERYPWVILQERLGPANLFNAICPDGEYALDLRNKDAQVLASPGGESNADSPPK